MELFQNISKTIFLQSIRDAFSFPNHKRYNHVIYLSKTNYHYLTKAWLPCIICEIEVARECNVSRPTAETSRLVKVVHVASVHETCIHYVNGSHLSSIGAQNGDNELWWSTKFFVKCRGTKQIQQKNLLCKFVIKKEPAHNDSKKAGICSRHTAPWLLQLICTSVTKKKLPDTLMYNSIHNCNTSLYTKPCGIALRKYTLNADVKQANDIPGCVKSSSLACQVQLTLPPIIGWEHISQ